MYISNISFGHKHRLKDYYLAGRLPTVKVGIYGGNLTKDNVTIEHIKPVSKGGKTRINNIALATWENNHNRKNVPLISKLKNEDLEKYLAQFVDVKLPNFDGNDYITAVRDTINNILANQTVDVSIIENYFADNKLPAVKYDLYGGLLTPNNVTLDYITPPSKGGKRALENVVLVTSANKQCKKLIPLTERFTSEELEAYLAQFANVKLQNFDGNQYIQGIRKTAAKYLDQQNNKINILKKYFLENKLPGVKLDLYGDLLTLSNVTLEYITPLSKGGKPVLENVALVTEENHSEKQNLQIKDKLTKQDVETYLKQFNLINLPEFNGESYINNFRKNIDKYLPKPKSEPIKNIVKLIDEILTVKD